MREIKFRAWDEEKKSMYYIDLYEYMSFDEEAQDNMITCNARKNGLMQYTGLKDKNGKEIYEGDIVKDRWGNNKEVSFSEIDFCTYDGSCAGYGFVLEDQYPSDYKQTVEIIGNIYENPDLIK
jgi:uncharacterized phage protein (TIGR01671 family)